MANSEDSLLGDLYNSAKELLTERFSSPFMFSFVVSWLVINYKVVIIALTDSSEQFDVSEKLQLISTYLDDTYYFTILERDYSLPYCGLVLPLIAAAFYSFIYPAFDWLVTRVTLFYKVQIRNLRVEAEGGLIYSFEDVKKIRKSYNISEEDLRNRLTRADMNETEYRRTIEELTARLAKEHPKTAEAELDTKRDDTDKISTEVNKKEPQTETPSKTRSVRSSRATNKTESVAVNVDELEVIRLLGNSYNLGKYIISEEPMKSSVKLNKVDFDIAKNSLIKKGLIERKYSGGEYYIRLLDNGLLAFKSLSNKPKA